MIEKHLTHPDSPIMAVVWEKSFSEQKVAPMSKGKSTDWPSTDINTQGSSGVTRMAFECGSPGNCSTDCLESLTSGAYTLEGSLFSIMVLCRLDMELGATQMPEGNPT